MKKHIIILIAALFMGVAASAQPYNWGVGVRGGILGGELTARHYLSSSTAMNLYADFSFNGFGWGIGGDYQFCYPVGGNGLEFYIGPGANIGAVPGDKPSLAVSVSGIAGLEYAFGKVPLALFLDYRPAFTLTFMPEKIHAGIGYADLALGVRFCF